MDAPSPTAPASTASTASPLVPRSLARLFGGSLVLLGVLLLPPWVTLTFAIAPLHAADGGPLAWLALGLVAFGVFVLRSRRRWAAGLACATLLIAAIECGTRVWLKWLADPALVTASCRLANRTYPDRGAYQAHPFLQFVGRPQQKLTGLDVLGESEFNQVGMIGPPVERAKPADVVRIAFLGGSTTADGYSKVAEQRLNELAHASGKRFQCYCFALGYYTSAHSVVNFVLNVLDYRPDYVVCHDGWNDLRANCHPDDFRGDYSHAYKGFEPPPIPDLWLVRASVVYRYLDDRIAPTPTWASLMEATNRPVRGGDGRALLASTFLRNLDTIVTLARANRITPVVVTHAHSTDPAIPHSVDAPGIAWLAGLMRDAAARYGDGAMLVDVDRMVTGKHDEFFTDVGHLTWAGVTFKGRAVADAIHAHWLAQPR